MSAHQTSQTAWYRFSRFLRVERGAVTVDWVILSAAVGGIGLSSAAAVRYGTGDLAQSIRNTFTSASVAMLGELGANNETYQTTTLSDGRIQRDVYVDGRLVRREVSDPNNVHSWASTVTYYDANGVRIADSIVYDDGRVADSTYVNNVIATREWRDTNNANSWQTLSDRFDAQGRMLSREAVNNDNSTYSEAYTEGRLAERVYRNVEGAVTMTEAHSYVLDAQGRWQERHIEYGDGRQLTTFYDAGRAVSQTVTDVNNAHNWTSQNWTWNEQGQVSSYDITRNDGTREEAIYTNNLISTYNHFNAAGEQVSSEARGYDAVGRMTSAVRTAPNGSLIQNEQRSYEGSGQIAVQDITYGDGRQLLVNHTNGLRTSQTWIDHNNTQSWTRQDSTFDSNNRLQTHAVTYDSGSGYVDTYTAGLISSRVETTTSGAVAVTSNWTYQLDSLSRVQVRNIDYSDGRQSVTTYSGNLPVQQTIADSQNAHWWSNQVHTYDSMGRTATAIVNYDDGRQYEDVYSAGVHMQRIFRDAQGNVTSVTNYG